MGTNVLARSAHRYRFRLSALDGPLCLPAGATAAQVRDAMVGHILAEAELVGRYQRDRR